MNELDHIHRSVSQDGEELTIDFLYGPKIELTRSQAMALLEVLEEQIPKMATDDPR